MSEHLPQGAAGGAALAAHAAECEACRAAPLPMDRIAVILNAADVRLDTAALSARVMVRLRRELAVAGGVSWRAVAPVLLRAVLPLPAVAVFDAYLLWTAYALGKTVLPGPLVGYVVVSYGAVLLLLFGLTYAAVPLLMARQRPARTATAG
jgi:hypothetical protein